MDSEEQRPYLPNFEQDLNTHTSRISRIGLVWLSQNTPIPISPEGDKKASFEVVADTFMNVFVRERKQPLRGRRFFYLFRPFVSESNELCERK